MHGNNLNTNKWFRRLCWVKTVRPENENDLGMRYNKGVDVYVRKVSAACGTAPEEQQKDKSLEPSYKSSSQVNDNKCNEEWIKLPGKDLGGNDVFYGQTTAGMSPD